MSKIKAVLEKAIKRMVKAGKNRAEIRKVLKTLKAKNKWTKKAIGGERAARKGLGKRDAWAKKVNENVDVESYLLEGKAHDKSVAEKAIAAIKKKKQKK